MITMQVRKQGSEVVLHEGATNKKGVKNTIAASIVPVTNTPIQ